MGCLYQRRVCRTCKGGRLKQCEEAGHDVVNLPTWWVKYFVNGRPQCRSAETKSKKEAETLLRKLEGKVAEGVALTAHVGRLRIDDAAADLYNDYEANQKRSLPDVKRRVEKHVKPFFGNRRLASITTADIRAFQKHRRDLGASNGEINRELTALKRMFSLAVQAGKLLSRPHIPMLEENNVRAGFFEPEQFVSVRNHLEPHFQGVTTFAYVTGWRTPSEVLPLEWRQVDFNAGEVRLDPGKTKNGDGRVFPFTAELQEVLHRQRQLADRLQREQGIITPYVFFYLVETKDGKAGKKSGHRITESGFFKAWKKASKAAGCPGRIPHDFRRTAVRRLEQAGVPRSVAMKLTGHKTEAVYRRYAIVSEGDLRAAAKRLDGYTNGYTEEVRTRAAERTARIS